MKSILKKIAAFTVLGFSFVSGVFAYNMDIPKRFLELGVDVDFGISNNYFAAKEMLKKEVVVDFAEMAGKLGDKGLQFDGMLNASGFMNLNLKNGISVNAKTGYESNGKGSISKELFDFIGNGNSMNETLSVDGDMNLDMFAYTSADVKFDLKDFRIGVGLGLFVPLMHVEATNTRAYFQNGPDGSIVTKATAGFKINSCCDMQPVLEDGFSMPSVTGENGATVGVDLNGSVEKEIFNSLTARGYMRLPIVPGSLKEVAYASYDMNYSADTVISMVQGGGDNFDLEEGDKIYGSEKYWISRPFHMGAEVAWRPFGQYVTFGGLLGFGVKYPWTSEATGFAEYRLSIDASIFNMLGLNLSTSYMNEVFVQQVGLMLNFRVLEIDVGVSSQGADFAKSCAGSGIGAFAAVKIGW